LIQEFQRLKETEQAKIGWTVKRELAKINYHINTDAIKENLIPIKILDTHLSVIYANEADILNVALFGITAKNWAAKNSDKKGNIRDYASINELICLSNLENINAINPVLNVYNHKKIFCFYWLSVIKTVLFKKEPLVLILVVV
jgi:hypothetical protein